MVHEPPPILLLAQYWTLAETQHYICSGHNHTVLSWSRQAAIVARMRVV